jgi:cold shock CspA family protein
MLRGTIKMFNREKGYGFIKPDFGVGDLFFHNSVLNADDGQMVPGTAVSYVEGVSPRSGKPCALSVDLVA